jgi:hypothetical protein
MDPAEFQKAVSQTLAGRYTAQATADLCAGKVCARCVLRLAGCKSPSLYAAADEVVSQAVSRALPHVEGSQVALSTAQCPLCLGLLQLSDVRSRGSLAIAGAANSQTSDNQPAKTDPIVGTAIARVCTAALADFDSLEEGFALHLTLPCALAVHQAAFLLARPSVQSSSCETIDAKDAMKLILTPFLESSLQCPYSAASDISITVVYSCEDADYDAADVLGLTKPTQQRRYARYGKGNAKRTRIDTEGGRTYLTQALVSKALGSLQAKTSTVLKQWAEQWSDSSTASNSAASTAAVTATPAAAAAAAAAATATATAINGAHTTTAGNGNTAAVASKAAAAVSTVADPDFLLHCSVTAARQPIYVFGRYCKLSRTVPQSPWLVGRGAGAFRVGHASVHEIVAEPFEAFTRCQEAKLAGAGREDINVRMLGT